LLTSRTLRYKLFTLPEENVHSGSNYKYEKRESVRMIIGYLACEKLPTMRIVCMECFPRTALKYNT